MAETGRRRVFGPLFYSTLAVAVVCVIGSGVSIVAPKIRQWNRTRILIQQARSPISGVRERAYEELSRIDPEAGQVAAQRAAADTNVAIRARAVAALAEWEPPASALKYLIAAADEREPESRRTAAFGLARLLVRDSQQRDANARLAEASRLEALTRLKGLLKDADVSVRLEAAGALGRVGFDPGADAELAAAMDDENPEVRLAAVRSLQAIHGPGDPTATRSLLKMLADPVDVTDHGRVLQALLANPDVRVHQRAVDVLVAALDASEPLYQFEAVDLLGRIGPAAAPALPALEALRDNTTDDDPRGRALIAMAEAAILDPKSPRGQSILAGLVGDATLPADIRHNALQTLHGAGPAALTQATPALIRQLSDPSPEVRLTAVSILGMILESAPAKLPGP